MSETQQAVFVGKSRTNTYRDYLAEDTFFVVFECDDVPKEEGKNILNHILESKEQHGEITNMHDFEDWTHKAVFTPDMPVDFSLALGVLNGNVMYIKTVGEGEIHLRRGKDFVRVIHSEKVASGFITEQDMLVFTTATFRRLVEEEEKLKGPLDKGSADQIVQTLEDYYDEKGDGGSLAVFAEVTSLTAAAKPVKHSPSYHKAAVEHTEDDSEEQAEVARPGVVTTGVAPVAATPPIVGGKRDFNEAPAETKRRNLDSDGSNEDGDELDKEPAAKSTFFSRIKLPSGGRQSQRSKMITMGVLAVIMVIFVWSVVFGYQRRQAAQARKQIDAVEASVAKKTTEAEDVAFLNMDRAIELLEEAKAEVADLRESVGKGYAREIDTIATSITEKENAIVQKDVQEPEEFYDLALEDQKAKGDKMFLEEDKIAILDKTNDTIYNFSADKKSIESSKNSAVGDATIVGMVDGALRFFVPGKGLYEFTDDTKVKQLIKNDSKWGTIADIAFFGGNVYMLDPKEGDIYKYAVIADGFGEKTSYFTGTVPDLDTANSLKIDASVYIGLSDSVLKFTRGLIDEFNVTLPEKSPEIVDIFTDENTERVYAWDKKNASIYIISKTGSYEGQVKSSVLAKASDFVVYNNQILVLSGSKIYTLSNDDTSSAEEKDEN